MLLRSFSYKIKGWEVSEINHLQLTNLFVGINASGKSRSIRAIMSIVAFLKSKSFNFPDFTFSSTIGLEAEDSRLNFKHIDYSFDIKNNIITKEILKVDGRIFIKRSQSRAVLKGETISPPEESLIVQIRRDKVLYPEIEALMKWADGVRFISFSDLNSFTSGVDALGIYPISFSDLVGNMSKEERETFYISAKNLGYDISLIETVTAEDQTHVAIKEKFVKNKIYDFLLSNGMLRVLYILAYLIKMRDSKLISLLLIDDLGEGLDYNRSTKLGNMVFDLCESSHVQLIATSNDSFMMDVVDLSRWHILRRDKSIVTSVNQKTHPELFEEFSFTGLSNFDFFSSDFINSYLDTAK